MLSLLRLTRHLQGVFRISGHIARSSLVISSANTVCSGFATFKQTDEGRVDNRVQHFEQEEQPETWKVDYSKVLQMYPFHHIPLSIIRNSSQYDMPQQLKHDLIAFKALSLRSQEDINLAAETILSQQLKNDFIHYDTNMNRGKRLFELYYQNRLQGYIQMLNNEKGSYEQRLTGLIVLCQLGGLFISNQRLTPINELKIVKQDETGVLLAYYIQYCIHGDIDYVHLIPVLLQKLEGDSIKPQDKLKIARAVISTSKHNFTDNYPQKVMDLAIETYASQLPELHNYEILYSIRYLYSYRSASNQRYAKAIMEHIKYKQIEEGNIDYHVPLILKAIKFCHNKRVSCEELITFITKNMNKFKIIFEKKSISKGLFFSLIFDRSHAKELSPEIVDYLKTYFLQTVKQCGESSEVDEGELVRVSKLLIKYFELMSEGQKTYLRQQYLGKIIPQFSHSQEILLYSLLVVLREPRVRPSSGEESAQFERDTALIKKMIVQYLKGVSEKDGQGYTVVRHVNSAVELFYQMTRHELDIPNHQLPNLLGYNFKQKQTLGPQCLGFFFSYLNHSHYSHNEIKATIDQIEPLLESYFRNKKIRSMSTVYNILHICDKVNYEHNFFYRHVETFIYNFLLNRQNYFIPEKDIKFLNDKLLKRGYGSHNLKRFIEGVLDNPKNWPRCRQNYLEKEQTFQSKMNQKRKRNTYR